MGGAEMRKLETLPCPFCGKIPSRERFCSTLNGPALMCESCGADGPPALKTEFVGANEDRLNPQAIKVWNQRALDSTSYRRGIEAAASYVEQFDKYVQHDYLLSDCILGKFNMIGKRKVRKNGKLSARALSAAIRYFQICFQGGTKVRHPDRVRAAAAFERVMKMLHSFASDRRTPVRRKGERRSPGGPDFILGSVLSKERREREKRSGARRRR
jgi:hypothetical protein